MRASMFAVLVVAGSVLGQERDERTVQSDQRASGRQGQLQSARNNEAPGSAPRASQPVMTGVVREFVGGHPDFGPAARPAGRHAGIVGDRLDTDGKPVFVSRGYPVLRPGRDDRGEAVIGPRRYLERRAGDRAPRVRFEEGHAVESARSLGAWFRDVAGVNRPSVLRLDFQRDSVGGGAPGYLAEVDVAGRAGAPGGGGAARTLELSGRLVYREGAGDRLRFSCADDLWVFVDGRLVVDLGGSAGPGAGAAGEGDAHRDDALPDEETIGDAAQGQGVELDRLAWLRDGEEYVVKIFCASRGGAPAPVRIETTAPFAGAAGAPALARTARAAVVEE